MSTQQVWFITGASKGLGLALVKKLLAAGHMVAATSRKEADLISAVSAATDKFLPLQADIKDESAAEAAIQTTINTFGRIDVVVNNAGYGIGGAIEELSDAETRQSFDVNVFGTLNVIRHVMPHLRAQQSGHIFNIASIAGIAPGTGWSIYAATKYAIVGLTDVLAADVKEFNIKVTLVAPGAFRTSFLTNESLHITSTRIDAYTAVHNTHEHYLKMDGGQAGDPDKAADVMIEVAAQDEAPLYLLLGSDAYTRAQDKLKKLADEYSKTETLTKSTDY